MPISTTTSLTFAPLGINIGVLIAEIYELLERAADCKEEMGAVNWGDLGIADIEYRLSILHPEDGPVCIVLIEEASPDCGLATWLNHRLDAYKFPNTYVECEW